MTEPFRWPAGGTLIMGVLNVTPDSFSDGGRFIDAARAVAHARALIAAGADLIDVGGESTRPGAEPVTAAEELRRVVPVIEELAKQGVSDYDAARREPRPPDDDRSCLISIDTTKAAVAEAALAAGARIVNDVTALRGDPRLVEVARAAGAGVVLMHLQGTPRTMQQQPRYGDVVAEVRAFLAERVAWAEARGIERARIAVDPGLGFGKTLEHNLALLAHLDEFQGLAGALAVGSSRKSFIGQVLHREVDQRLWGTAATVAWAVAHGARVVRVHDVAALADVVRMTEAIQRWN